MYTAGVALAFGVIGYLMIKADLPRAPLVLALVLAPLMESSLRQSLMLSDGSLWIFIERPLAAVFLVTVLLSLLWPMVQALRQRARRTPQPLT
jgi:putative tricarboxylic transport membrane protein